MPLVALVVSKQVTGVRALQFVPVNNSASFPSVEIECLVLVATNLYQISTRLTLLLHELLDELLEKDNLAFEGEVHVAAFCGVSVSASSQKSLLGFALYIWGLNFTQL